MLGHARGAPDEVAPREVRPLGRAEVELRLLPLVRGGREGAARAPDARKTQRNRTADGMSSVPSVPNDPVCAGKFSFSRPGADRQEVAGVKTASIIHMGLD